MAKAKRVDADPAIIRGRLLPNGRGGCIRPGRFVKWPLVASSAMPKSAPTSRKDREIRSRDLLAAIEARDFPREPNDPSRCLTSRCNKSRGYACDRLIKSLVLFSPRRWLPLQSRQLRRYRCMSMLRHHRRGMRRCRRRARVTSGLPAIGSRTAADGAGAAGTGSPRGQVTTGCGAPGLRTVRAGISCLGIGSAERSVRSPIGGADAALWPSARAVGSPAPPPAPEVRCPIRPYLARIQRGKLFALMSRGMAGILSPILCRRD
jgi:hypothetical protein